MTSCSLIELRFETLLEKQKGFFLILVEEDPGESQNIFRSQFENDWLVRHFSPPTANVYPVRNNVPLL
jgi:hypothetical protein